MLKRICVFSGILLCSANVWAAPAAPIEVELTQPDSGETFWARPRGSEYADWMETAEGYTILEGPGGVWYYADQEAEGNLISTGIRAEEDGTKSALHVPLHLSPPPNPDMVNVNPVIMPLGQGKSLVHTQKILTILVDFSDIAFTYSDAAFQSLIYGASNSVKDFYLENSYDNFTVAPAAETYGTANDGIVHVIMGTAHPNLGNSAWNGVVGSYISAANGSVDFASFDTNANGSLSASELSIVLILAGYENSFGGSSSLTPRIWGHKWDLSSPIVLDGKTISPYTAFGERHATSLPGSHQATIGIMCHELGHLMFGLPDLYDIDSGNGTSEGIGEWGLMGSGSWNTTTSSGDTPAHLDAWCKAVLDITTPVDINTATNDVSLLEASTNASIARIWIDPYKSPRGEYFLLENRQLSGYDAGLPGSGLLIFHVDGAMSSNGDETHKWVDLEEADGLAHLDSNTNRGDGGDPFPGTTSNVTFNSSSNPNSDDYDSLDTGIAVTGIPASGATMAVDITPRTGGIGDHVNYDELGASGYAYGIGGSMTIWTALRVTNSTSMDTLDGFEVFVIQSGASIDFRLYESLSGSTPTNLLYTQTGFAATSGWNRFMLSTPQSFPASADRLMVLKIVQPSNTIPGAIDFYGANSGRSYIDSDGAGAFSATAYDLNQVALLSLSAPPTPVADLSSATYSVNEGDGVVTITVNLDVAPATTCSVQYATSNGTAAEPGDYTNTSGTLTFTSSDTFLTFDVPIVDDGESESPETFTVTLSTPTNCTLSGTNNPATVTITSNDIPQAIVYADFAWTGDESGTFGNPYNTFSEAVAGVSSGGTINIDGTSGDTVSGYTGTLNTAMTLKADPIGAVQIGSTGGGSK